MITPWLKDKIRFFVNRIRERLWVKPLATCLLSIVGVFAAKMADNTDLGDVVPEVSPGSVEILLSIMASSMMVIATFAVGSMVSAYASVSNTASPRSFAVVISDDVSQRSLSTFIGAFIFSIVGIVATKNEYFDKGGRFVLFTLTLMTFGLVVFTFVRWVDSIARLGRVGSTVAKVENATALALKRRKAAPTLHGVSVKQREIQGMAVFADAVGYVQRINMSALQHFAENAQGRVTVGVLPGAFICPGRAVAHFFPDRRMADDEYDLKRAANAFSIGGERMFDEDPRFGIIVLSQIAGRALSSAVNDPGTAIDIIGVMVRLLTLWGGPDDAPSSSEVAEVSHDRVEVPELSLHEMFDDAFMSMARDGSGTIEVILRLQKALSSLASLENVAMRDAAVYHARRVMSHAENGLGLSFEKAMAREASAFAFDGDDLRGSGT